MRGRLFLVVIPLAALICVAPLLWNGCSCGHDFDFHLLTWLEAARQFRLGNLHPHWDYAAAFGAGEPRFVFYPPLSWTLGALLTLVLSHAPGLSPEHAMDLSPIVYTWMTLCTAGVAMHALARRYAGRGAALVAATLYLANPYTLFTAYERTAYAELLAATWIPLLLLAVLPTASAGGVSVPLLASAVALLWLTNAPAAVMGCYALVFLALLRLLLLYRERRGVGPLLRPAGQMALGALLGLGLAAFYIVPAAYERRWVLINMATIPGMRIADNTLFHRMGDADHDAVVHTVSIIAVVLILLSVLALVSIRFVDRAAPHGFGPADSKKRLAAEASRNVRVLLGATVLAIAFLLTPLSAPLWRFAPELAFLQFPWRFLAILAPVFALAVALALRGIGFGRRGAIVASLLVPLVLVPLAYANFRQVCDEDETPGAELRASQSQTGTEPTDEYTPTTADNDALQKGSPGWRLLPAAGAAASSGPVGEAPPHLDVDTVAAQELVLNLRNFPAWEVLRNGLPVEERVDRDDGLVEIHLPPGRSHIDLVYRTSPDQMLGDAISGGAVCVMALLVFVSRRGRGVRDPGATADLPSGNRWIST